MASGASTDVMRARFIVRPFTVHILFLLRHQLVICDVFRRLLGERMTKVFPANIGILFYWFIRLVGFCFSLVTKRIQFNLCVSL